MVGMENPAEVLRDQDGTFNVTSRYGHIFRVTCRKGRNMRVSGIGHTENSPFSQVAHHDRFDGPVFEPTTRRWQIEKIA